MILKSAIQDEEYKMYKNNDDYLWVHFNDDSWEEWINRLPRGGVLIMPKEDKNMMYSRDFIISVHHEDFTSYYDCTINKVPMNILE